MRLCHSTYLIGSTQIIAPGLRESATVMTSTTRTHMLNLMDILSHNIIRYKRLD